MAIRGVFGACENTRQQPAQLLVGPDSVSVICDDGRTLAGPEPLPAIDVSPRIGNTPRHLRFPSGDHFTTEDNAAIDALIQPARPRAGFVHGLESRWSAVLVALVVTIATVAALVHWGVPAAARHVAFNLPPSVMAQSENTVLRLLDAQVFKPSQLPAERQAHLQAAFAPMLAAHATEFDLNVRFRDAADSLGANALALPDGAILFTDQLVLRAKHDEELTAILSHEIGHVVNRHALRSTLQASALSLAAMLLLGDVSSVASLVATLPVALTELGYSRDFEREADTFAVAALQNAGISPQRLADILERIAPDGDSGYLSTHPPTPERIRRITADDGEN